MKTAPSGLSATKVSRLNAARVPDAWTAWFAQRNWRPLPFQRDVWTRYLNGESGLLHTPTGSGKTLAAIGGPLIAALRKQDADADIRPARRRSSRTAAAGNNAESTAGYTALPAPPRLRVLWITPLRALATDTTRALSTLVGELSLPWRVAMRTGDASASDRRAARLGQAEILVITPESLSLLLCDAGSALQFDGLEVVIVDEWHELLGNKRGVLLQLALARVRQRVESNRQDAMTRSPAEGLTGSIAPAASTALRIWGLSATLGNLEEARTVLLPHLPHAALIGGARPRTVQVRSLLTTENRRLPWAGHMGLAQLPQVYAQLQKAPTSLLFTNTRAQAELWHQALSAIWLEAPETLALHHGSLDPKLRLLAEQGLRDGTVRCVVATSSLDLGVDFPAVDQVLQIGSPKGVARLLQRAGRARHRPGASGQVLCVPAQALDLLEYAAARRAIEAGRIEARRPLRHCLDVLAQHCVTLALGGGFDADSLLQEVRGTFAYRGLEDGTWQSVLDFIVQGGNALDKYPEYRKVERDADGRYRVNDRRIAMRHRLSIGTIASDGALAVRLLRGAQLGSIEESFASRLKPGDVFQFAGRQLQMVRIEGMTLYVRKAKSGQVAGAVAVWQGGRMPLSSELAHETEALLARQAAISDDLKATVGPKRTEPEIDFLSPLLDLQRRQSALPSTGQLLCEIVTTRRGWHLFIYPFAGRAAHEGLAALIAHRWGQMAANTFSYAVNDYGLMLTLAVPPSDDNDRVFGDLLQTLLQPAGLLGDLADSINLGELARRQFREVARVAGLLPPNLPGRVPPSMRQLQASSSLLYDVLRRYDPSHILLAQAEREVFEQQLELSRLEATLQDCSAREWLIHRPDGLTPLSFSLWAESLRGQFSNEEWHVRVQRAADQLEERYRRAASSRGSRRTGRPRGSA